MVITYDYNFRKERKEERKGKKEREREKERIKTCFYRLNMLAGSCNLTDPNVKLKTFKYINIINSASIQFGHMLNFLKYWGKLV